MKTFWIRLINSLIIVGLLAGYNGVLKDRETADQIARLNAELESANLFKLSVMQVQAAEQEKGYYTDGHYSGEADGFGGVISVDVTVDGGNITDITITSAEHEDGAYLEMAWDIIPAMIEAQSADVDTVSGATFSSTGIKNAVIQALEKAEK